VSLRNSAAALGAAVLVLPVTAFADDAALTVQTGGQTVKLGVADLRKLPAVKVRAMPEHRSEGEYTCASAANVLSAAGVEFGKGLRGKRMTETLLVRAADNYEVVFALAELDPDFTDRQVLLCYAKDGAALAADEGPLRVVVPGEKRQARWVRQVTDFSVGKPQ
jgi:acyl transferase domain-containing protein